MHGYVLARQIDQNFERAQRRVGARDLGGERDERVVVIGDRREVTGFLRGHAFRVTTPEIDFPGSVEPDLIVVEAARLNRVQRELARLVDGGPADGDLHLRVSLAMRVTQPSARFENP